MSHHRIGTKQLTTIEAGRLHLFEAPRYDELFSSWLLRVARKRRETPYRIGRLVVPHKRVWSQDVDRSTLPEDFSGLSDVLGVPVEAVVQTLICDTVFGYPSDGILTLGVYHKYRRQHGLSYCPRCLADSHTKYFKKQWRLVTQVVCLNHAERLQDACPYCDATVCPHLSFNDMAMCFSCGADLSSVRAAASKEAISTQVRINKFVDAALTSQTDFQELISLWKILIYLAAKSEGENVRQVDNRYFLPNRSRMESRYWSLPWLLKSLRAAGSNVYDEVSRAFLSPSALIEFCGVYGVPKMFGSLVSNYRPLSEPRRNKSGPSVSGQGYKKAAEKLGLERCGQLRMQNFP